jgi:hypothetical protein
MSLLLRLFARADPFTSRVGALLDRFWRHAPVVDGPTIQQVAADLRRLSAELRAPGPCSAIRHQALIQAYEQTLQTACAALAVQHSLDELTGLERDLECARMEGELQAAGLRTRR